MNEYTHKWEIPIYFLHFEVAKFGGIRVYREQSMSI